MTSSAITTDDAKRALLERLIDDAGLFPPAQLPMRAAFRAHLRHGESAYAFLGGRFVVRASQIDELLAVRDATQAVELSVILDADTDVHRVAALRAPGTTVSSLETPLEAATNPDTLQRLLTQIADAWGGDDVTLWCEPAFSWNWVTPIDTTLGALAAARASAPPNVTIGAKLRCGGLTLEAAPSVDDLAAFVVAAQQHGVPWKATAGLHHPVRGAYEGRAMHGFLNLFVAGVLLHAGVLSADGVAAVIAEHHPRAFVVDPAHVAWRDVGVNAATVAAAREHCVAFGSCSFDEPVDGLRALGILL